MKLKDKVIILSGAGRGIGREIAIRLSKDGAILKMLSRTENDLQETMSLLNSPHPETCYFVADISDEWSIRETYLKIISVHGRIDVLVNNAGIQNPIGLFHENDFDLWKKNITINVFGAAFLTHLVLQDMTRNGKGKIINMSGGGSTGPRPHFSAYAVAKTAIVRFTENLAEEYRAYHIDVNAIAPGAVNTRMLEEVLDAGDFAGKELHDAKVRKEKGGTDPALAADLISFLASDHSDGITGKLISAPWDLWNDSNFLQMLRIEKDFATLRRIDNRNFFKR